MYRRRQVIIREQLRFPSGFSTAVLIGVLHGKSRLRSDPDGTGSIAAGFASLAVTDDDVAPIRDLRDGPSRISEDNDQPNDPRGLEWKANVRLLLVCFFVSGLFTFATFFFPVLRNIPIFGGTAASMWLWTLNPSLAYVGQGIIMGPATTLHMYVDLTHFVGLHLSTVFE